jgi:hypothetical protein
MLELPRLLLPFSDPSAAYFAMQAPPFEAYFTQRLTYRPDENDPGWQRISVGPGFVYASCRRHFSGALTDIWSCFQILHAIQGADLSFGYLRIMKETVLRCVTQTSTQQPQAESSLAHFGISSTMTHSNSSIYRTVSSTPSLFLLLSLHL